LPANKRQYRVVIGDALAAHETAIRQFGGKVGIHNLGYLEAALVRPYCGYFRSFAKKAVVLMHAVACSHAFNDGNKRTALILFHLFREKSGYSFRKTSTPPDGDDIEHMILDLTTRFIDIDEATFWLKNRIARV